MGTRTFMLLLSTLVALLATGVVQARGSGRAIPPSVAATDPITVRPNSTLPDSVRLVERQTGGEVLRAEPMQQDGREVYRLKVLTRDGRVRVMQTDPSQPATDSPTDKHKRKPGIADQENDENGG